MYGPKKYLFFLISDIKGQEAQITKALNEIMYSVSSDRLGFNFDDNILVAHFESEHKFESLKENFDFLFQPLICTFFLMEINDNIHTRMEAKSYHNLFNLLEEQDEFLESDSKNFSVKDFSDEEKSGIQKLMNWIFSSDNPENEPDLLFEMMDDEDEQDSLIKQIKKDNQNKLKTVTIDDVLDKINKDGIKSLTKYEQQILKNHAK